MGGWYCLLCLVCLLPYSVCAGCTGLGKAMRRLKCGEPPAPEEDALGQERRKEFLPGPAGEMVQGHYAHLPYPPFSMSDLARELAYYAGQVRERPLFQSFANSLDMLNHHLYRVAIPELHYCRAARTSEQGSESC